MTRWCIDRTWWRFDESGSREELRTQDLVGHRACCLLGSAGIGKTFELKYLEELERHEGYEIRHARLAELATTPDRLISALDALCSGGSENTAIYLDAVDEAMVPVKTTGLILADVIHRNLSEAKPLLRVSCRSAIWPRSLENAISDVYGAKDLTRVYLLQLNDSDVATIASAEGVAAAEFLSSVNRSGVGLLSQQPLTLRMLLRLFEAHGVLPTRRRDLFDQAVSLLAREREERRELGTCVDVEPADVIEAAERLACFSVLSGRDTVDLSDDPAPSTLEWSQLSSLPSSKRPLDDRLLRAIGCSGLCEGDGANRFRFIHRQLAEYLAGRRLAKLLLHQARGVLCSSLGWSAGVAGPLRETAAFASMENHDLAQWITATDPEIIGLSDVADDDLRRTATLQLIDKFRRHELTDSQLIRDSLPLTGLRYPGAEGDIKPILIERTAGCEDVLEFAIQLVANWELASLHNDIADLVLDPSAPFHPRVSAGYLLARSGELVIRRRLKPLIAGSVDDPDDELTGLALRCNWPENLTTRELLQVLRQWGNRRLHGAYYGFLHMLDQDQFNASDDIIAGLTWARSNLNGDLLSDPTARIAKRIAHASIEAISDLEVVDALTSLLIEAARCQAESPLSPIQPNNSLSSDMGDASSPLSGREDVRRILIANLCAKAGREQDLVIVTYATPQLLGTEDFAWLLERAVDEARPMQERENYATLAQRYHIYSRPDYFDAWLSHRETEPVKSKLDWPLSIRLDSEEARLAKHHLSVTASEGATISARVCHESFDMTGFFSPQTPSA